MDQLEQMLRELTEAVGVSGHEEDVSSVMEKHLSGFGQISHDRLGSLICKKIGKENGPSIMLAAHMDEVGFMVKQVTKVGFIKFLPIGGWWGHVALAQRVVLRTSKGDFVGIIGSKPPHELMEEEKRKVQEFKDMFIDVGATGAFNVKTKLGVKPGDPIVPFSPFTVMGNKRFYMAKAWDDRMGCAVIIEVFRRLQKVRHPNAVYGVGTVQEEVGLRGAQTSVAAVKPDVGFALDVSISHDTPGSAEGREEKMGAGAAVVVYDGSMIPNAKLRDMVVDIAESKGIPYHFAYIERGGTDCGKIHLHDRGVPSLTLGIPTRYIHSHTAIIDRKDFEALVRLVTEVIKRLDSKTVRALTR
ncbi:MAG: M42 family metallopeptidase [Candidatus Eiseniibacteriota bacterium]|nr:MAG: M42 family metallopeptidase [Candidatus Eisenbacteria bacterium]